MKPSEQIRKILEKGSKSENPLDIYDFSKTIPLYTPLYKLVSFAETVKEIKSNINSSVNPRVIVLETWLLLDFCIRDLLLSGLNLKGFQIKNFDILPISFKGCINLLENLIKDQLKKEPNPIQNFPKLSGEFTKFFYDNYKAEYEIFGKIEWEYIQKVHPEKQLTTYVDFIDNPSFRNVPAGWIDVVKKLDKQWFKKASQLNSCRNFAAHDLDYENIFKQFGINGSTKKVKIKLLKDKCMDLLNLLIGVKV